MSIVIYSIVLHVYNFHTNGIIQGLSRIWPRNEKMVSIWKSFASIYHISRLIKKSHMIQYPLDKHLKRLQDKMFFNVWMYCVRFHGFWTLLTFGAGKFFVMGATCVLQGVQPVTLSMHDNEKCLQLHCQIMRLWERGNELTHTSYWKEGQNRPWLRTTVLSKLFNPYKT